MNLRCRHRTSLIVASTLAFMNGCGSSPEIANRRTDFESSVKNEAVAESTSSSDSLTAVVMVESQRESPGAVSALEIANPEPKVFSKDELSGALNVSFADLNLKAVLGIDSVTEDDVKSFPSWLKELEGTKIRIRGYMFPTFEDTGIREFVLDHSARAMNFGVDAKVYELLHVALAPGKTTNHVPSNRSMEVIGIFRIAPEYEKDTMYALYFLDDAVIVANERNPAAP
ncbi:MAG: hypothetical protein JWP89_6667 [Schlesneria sp.]|nr:hypothetical protein [Schlesneria sp.]